MKLQSVSIKNFRNLKSINYQPGPKLNIITGDNAQGKTNLLEAIFVLATGASFRSATYANLIQYQSSRFIVKAEHIYNQRTIESNLEYSGTLKTFKINNKKAVNNHPDRLRVILFTPDDLYLVKGNPSRRRSFIDFILKQISDSYLYNLDNYVKILKKRNLLLKNEQTNSKTFKIINDLYIENAARVIFNRIKFVNMLDEIIGPIYQKISPASWLKIRYALSFPVNSDKISLDVLQEALHTHIENNFNNEVIRKSSLFGPHVDDINFYQDEKLARFFASQGQQRSIVLSLKLAEMYCFKKIKGYFPIFLLDEVLAELDEERRILLLDYLTNADFQSFLTSVSSSYTLNIAAPTVVVKEGGLI